MSQAEVKGAPATLEIEEAPPAPAPPSDEACPSCGYNIGGVPREGVCPECGRGRTQGPSLKSKAIRASVWTLGGYGASYVLRFMSTVLVTHIIAKGDLGLMSLASSVITGLWMFSETGVAQSIVQNPRGEEARFQNTGWTIEVIRGVVLALGALLLSWPVAAFYEQPTLKLVLPMAGAAVLLQGFMSTSVCFLRRHFAMSKVMFIELSAQAAGLVTTLLVAWRRPDVWAVVWGLMAASTVKVALSHVIVPGVRNRFQWDPAAFRAIFRFGFWIFLSSVVSFISSRTDRFALGAVSLAILQVYGVALSLSDTASDIGMQITYNVLFPAWSRASQQGVERLKDVYYRSRLWLDMVCVTLCGGVGGAAPWLIHFLYPDDYAEARWMLRVLSFRGAMACVLVPCESLLFSMGRSQYGFLRNLARAVWVAAAVPVGWHFWGLPGFVGAMLLTEVPVLLVLWPAMVRHRLFRLSGELRPLAFLAVGFGLGWLLQWAMLSVVPGLRMGPILHQIAAALGISKH